MSRFLHARLFTIANKNACSFGSVRCQTNMTPNTHLRALACSIRTQPARCPLAHLIALWRKLTTAQHPCICNTRGTTCARGVHQNLHTTPHTCSNTPAKGGASSIHTRMEDAGRPRLQAPLSTLSTRSPAMLADAARPSVTQQPPRDRYAAHGVGAPSALSCPKRTQSGLHLGSAWCFWALTAPCAPPRTCLPWPR